jgi:hypothetical protein
MKKSTIAIALAVLTVAGCVKEEVVGGSAGAGVGPSLVVERFMRAVNANPTDLMGMGSLFGTPAGSASDEWPRAEVESRMFAIARELKHQDFEITSQQLVPGRTGEATQLMLRIKINNNNFNVPFILVRYKDTWLIEQIGIDVITRPR